MAPTELQVVSVETTMGSDDIVVKARLLAGTLQRGQQFLSPAHPGEWRLVEIGHIRYRGHTPAEQRLRLIMLTPIRPGCVLFAGRTLVEENPA